MTETEFKTLKDAVEDARDKATRARGSLDELMRQLEKEFNCKVVKEGRALLLKIQEQRDRADDKLHKAETAYVKKWDK
jgi:phosphate starvation-inducible protein PhoH